MKILVINDDGIHAPGLWAAVDTLKDTCEVYVVAPDREQSGVGTSLTLHNPIRASRVPPSAKESTDGVTAYSVEGTPGDACVLALEKLVGPVDLVVAGINRGSNLGQDVLVSGTVGGALQAHVRGYPTVAISVAAIKDTRYDVACDFLRVLIGTIVSGVAVLPPSLINVNIPNRPAGNIEGVMVTRLGLRSYTESVTEDEDGMRKYYWVSRNNPVHQDTGDGTDIWALASNLISVTPIYTRLTDEDHIPALEDLFDGYSSRLFGKVNPGDSAG